MKELIEQCRYLIAEDDLEEAINLLLTTPMMVGKYQNELLGFKRRIAEISKSNEGNLRPHDDISREKAKLTDSLLGFLKRLSENDTRKEISDITTEHQEEKPHPSNLKRILAYLSQQVQLFRYSAERFMIGGIYFVPGFYAAQALFHKWGKYEIGYEWKFVALFAGVIGAVSLLMNAVVKIDFYRLSRIQLRPVQETLITVMIASAFLWISSWMPNPVPSEQTNAETTFKAIDEILKTQEVRHPRLIEAELLKTENISLIQSGLRALSAYNKEDRALQALFTILRKRDSMLSDPTFYQSMKYAVQSYESRAVGGLNKLFLAYKDSIAILYSIPDSAVTPMSNYISAEKLKLKSEQLNQEERATLEKKIIAMEAFLAIVDGPESNVASSTGGKTLMLNFVIDVLNSLSVPSKDPQLYQISKDILQNKAYPVETRAKLIQFISNYQISTDAEYFAGLLESSTEDAIKIAVLDAMAKLRTAKSRLKQ